MVIFKNKDAASEATKSESQKNAEQERRILILKCNSVDSFLQQNID